MKLIKGTRFISFLFIGTSALIAAGIIWGASVYYNIDTAEVVMEEIQRVTGVLRATAGVIVGGTASQNPSAGYGFEVATSTKLATTTVATGTLELTAADQVLKFTGGTGYYVGFKATTTLATTTVYTWPGIYATTTGYVLQSTNRGVLSWLDLGAAGLGDITAIGDVATGAAFTSDGIQGTSLWFYDSDGRGQLTIDNLSAARTYTLPDVSGTLALGTSTANYVAYWTSTSTLAGEQYLAVTRGGTGAGAFTSYGLLYGNGTGAFGVTASGTADYLLAGAGSGSPTWKYLDQLLTDGTNISLSGTTNVTIATVNNPTFSTSVTSPQFLSTAGLLIQSAGGDITIDPSSGKIVLGSGDWIETNSGYQIGKSGTQVLREMIPILGFDLPAQTATTSYVKISRTLENYPFSAAATGTTRVHKFVIRYTDNIVLAASTTDWRVATTTGAAYSAFTLGSSNNSALDSGQATTTGTVAIPTDGTDWWLEVKSQEPYDTNKIKVFEIFLAAYDQIQ